METKILAWSGYTTNQLIHKFYKRFAAWMAMVGSLHYGRYQSLVTRNNWALPKVACTFLAARYFERFIEQWKNIRHKIPKAPEKILYDESKPQIDWRNVEDIAAFLLETGWLRIKDLKRYFKVDAQWVKKFGNNCERVGILKQGPSNSRVLATRNKDYILEMLLSSSDSNTMGRRTENWIDYKPQPTEE